MDGLVTFLQIQQNNKASAAIDRAVEVLLWPHEDRDSVRSPGWYVAQCDSCDWHTSGGESVVEDSCREHIVEKHPPREVAEVDATRRIIELCSSMLWEHEGGPDVVAAGTLRLLALPDVGHPDYRESWRP